MGCKIGLQFNNSVLVTEKNSHATKIVNAYIVYDLDYWSINPLNNLILKNCLLVATNVVNNSDKSKYVYNGYGIAFDGDGSWSFGNDFARNSVFFGVNNSSSSHTDHLKNNFLVFSEGPTMI